MQLLFTVSVAILSVAGASALPENDVTNGCVNAAKATVMCNPTGSALSYPGGACSTTAAPNTCVGETCGSESCDPRAKLDGSKGAQFCCHGNGGPKCVDWDAKGSNCKAAGPVNRVPKCELIDAKNVAGDTTGGQGSPSDNKAGASSLKYFQILDPGYHFCPTTQQCERLEIGAGQSAICPNWDKWVFRPATTGATCTVGGDDTNSCPSNSWNTGNIASFSLGVKTSSSNPSVQCGGSFGTNFYAAKAAGGTCAKAHLWYYRVEYPNGYVDQWEFCDNGPTGQTGSSLTWSES